MVPLNEKYAALPQRSQYYTRVFREYVASCPKDVDIQFCREVAFEARLCGLWVYHSRSRKWSSCSDFADGVWNYKLTDKSHFDDIEFRDPLEGIEAGHQVIANGIKKLLNRLEYLIKIAQQSTPKQNEIDAVLRLLDEIRYNESRLRDLSKKVILYDRRRW